MKLARDATIRKFRTVQKEGSRAMLSSVLNIPRAIQVNIEIMRTFCPVAQNSCVACRLGRTARTVGTKI